MKFKELRELVELNLQDGHSKLPSKFNTWNLLIKQSIKKIADKVEIEELISNAAEDDVYRDIYTDLKAEEETDYFLKEPVGVTEEDGDIILQEDLVMAVVYDLSQIFIQDKDLKQKYIMEFETVINDYIWNKYKNEELSK